MSCCGGCGGEGHEEKKEQEPTQDKAVEQPETAEKA